MPVTALGTPVAAGAFVFASEPAPGPAAVGTARCRAAALRAVPNGLMRTPCGDGACSRRDANIRSALPAQHSRPAMLALREGHRPAARLAGVQLFCDRRLPAGVACVPGLTAMGVGLPGLREETLAGLPGTDGARILAAADRNGGRAEWGLRELIPGRLHAEPAVLLERLLPAIIKLLNELMAATPVEDLSGSR